MIKKNVTKLISEHKKIVTLIITVSSLAVIMLLAYAALNKGTYTVEKILNLVIGLVMGLVFAGGILNIVMGFRNLAQGINSESGDLDLQKISKGEGQLCCGIIMAGGIAVLALLGINGYLVEKYVPDEERGVIAWFWSVLYPYIMLYP